MFDFFLKNKKLLSKFTFNGYKLRWDLTQHLFYYVSRKHPRSDLFPIFYCTEPAWDIKGFFPLLSGDELENYELNVTRQLTREIVAMNKIKQKIEFKSGDSIDSVNADFGYTLRTRRELLKTYLLKKGVVKDSVRDPDGTFSVCYSETPQVFVPPLIDVKIIGSPIKEKKPSLVSISYSPLPPITVNLYGTGILSLAQQKACRYYGIDFKSVNSFVNAKVIKKPRGIFAVAYAPLPAIDIKVKPSPHEEVIRPQVKFTHLPAVLMGSFSLSKKIKRSIARELSVHCKVPVSNEVALDLVEMKSTSFPKEVPPILMLEHNAIDSEFLLKEKELKSGSSLVFERSVRMNFKREKEVKLSLPESAVYQLGTDSVNGFCKFKIKILKKPDGVLNIALYNILDH